MNESGNHQVDAGTAPLLAIGPSSIDVHKGGSDTRANGEREDSVSFHFVPSELLRLWEDWGSLLTKDLSRRSERIDLFELVDDAMESVKRITDVFFEQDLDIFQAEARVLVQAADRLPAESLVSSTRPTAFVA
jgi:hypothetical protein